jgi:hypothetical protein
MAFCAGWIDVVSLVHDVRGSGANVFVVGVGCTDSMTLDAPDFLGQMDLAYLLTDKGQVADIAGSIRAKRIDEPFRLLVSILRIGLARFRFGLLVHPVRAGAGLRQKANPQIRQEKRGGQDA